MSKNYAIIIHFMLPLTTFYRSRAHRSDVYKWDAFVTSWRFYNRAWQPQRHDRLPETSGTLWIHRGALTNQRCSLATGCGIQVWTLCTSDLCACLCLCCVRFLWTSLFFIRSHWHENSNAIDNDNDKNIMIMMIITIMIMITIIWK